MSSFNRLKRLAGLTLVSLALAACTDLGSSGTQSAQPLPDFSTLSARSLVELGRVTKGFEFGGGLSIRTVYVFFDPQCPHCGRLWGEMGALKNQAKFIWIPVNLMNRASTSQGAAILEAEDPVLLMHQHEKLLLGGRGGITGLKDVSDETRAALDQNTRVLNHLGAQGVPFIVGLNSSTNSVVTIPGAVDARGLAQYFGWSF